MPSFSTIFLKILWKHAAVLALMTSLATLNCPLLFQRRPYAEPLAITQTLTYFSVSPSLPNTLNSCFFVPTCPHSPLYVFTNQRS